MKRTKISNQYIFLNNIKDYKQKPKQFFIIIYQNTYLPQILWNICPFSSKVCSQGSLWTRLALNRYQQCLLNHEKVFIYLFSLLSIRKGNLDFIQRTSNFLLGGQKSLKI